MIFNSGYSGPKWPGLLWVLASFFTLVCGVLAIFPLFSERGVYIHLLLTEDHRSYWLLTLALLIWPAWRNFRAGAIWFLVPFIASILLSLPLIQSGMLHKQIGCTTSFQFTKWLTKSKTHVGYTTLKAAHDSSELALIYKSAIPNSPVIFLLHGGGFYQGKPIYMHDWCSALAESGITAVSLAYPLEPNAVFPSPEDSVAARIQRLKPQLAKEGADTNRIFIGGSSAGATLAISAALRHPNLKLQGIIAAYPLVSLCTDFETIMDLNRVKKAYIGKTNCRDVDILQRLQANAPPLLILHGAKDNVVPADQSERLFAAYSGKKRLVILPWAGHNFEYPIYGPSGQLLEHLSEDFILKEAH
jgi:acetyl esterase/lipase